MYVPGGSPPVDLLLMQLVDDSDIRNSRVSTLQNTSTVSIFFSGVSATTLQYSGQLKDSTFTRSFNFLWLLSLLLSTAGAIQCQLAVYWHTSRHRHAVERTPRLIKAAASEIPLMLLGASSLTFLIGLAFFTFSASSNHSFLAIGITLLICVVGGGVVGFIFWLVHERNVSLSGARKARGEPLLRRYVGTPDGV